MAPSFAATYLTVGRKKRTARQKLPVKTRGEALIMKKSTKCMTLLAFLLLLSTGVNSLFIGIPGGAMKAQHARHEVSARQQASALECTPDTNYCSTAIR
jgi:hypothetical protein